MQSFPSLPSAAETPDLFESGHLWIQELVVGAPLRFRLEPSGQVTFAGRERRFEDPPPSLRAAVRHVRERLDRAVLMAVARDPSEVVFYGVATRHEGVDYDWERLPPFLGTDVHAAERQGFLPPDVVERTFERVGLDPVDAVEKEVRATDFDPADYDLPASAWYDGPAAGVVIRNKTGGRAAIRGDVRGDPGELQGDPAELAEAVVTPARVRRVDGEDFDERLDRVLDAGYREEHARLPEVDGRAFRSAVVERVRELGRE